MAGKQLCSKLLGLVIVLLGFGILACPPVQGADTPAAAHQAKLLVTLPDYCPTPDGMAIDSGGNLIVACPNYGAPSQPACLIKIDRQLRITKWIDVPVLAETGRACPMGIAFGPDGDLFVCDNQNWPTGNGDDGELNQGRILRLRIRDGKLLKTTIVAQGISHPNGIRVQDNQLYVTVSMLPKIKRADGLLVSGVYRFGINDQDILVTNTKADAALLVTMVTRNPDCQYGADGLVFNSKGDLFVGNFGDGALHKFRFDQAGKVIQQEVFAKTSFATPMADSQFTSKMVQAPMRTTDGICIDERDNIYVADFSNNAVCRVTPQGEITVLAQSPDCDGSNGGLDQPGEPIVWNGKLVVTCFDMVTGPDKVNSQHDKPYTISYLEMQ